MGRPKALLPVGKRTLIEHTLAQFDELDLPRHLLGVGEIPPALAGLERIADAPEAAGPLAGILAALRRHPGAAWLVVACDLPLIERRAIDWLVAQRGDRSVAILPSIDGRRAEPLFAIYEPTVLPRLEARAARGEFALHDLRGASGVATPVPPAEIAACWTNVNTPEEWAAASALLTARAAR